MSDQVDQKAEMDTQQTEQESTEKKTEQVASEQEEKPQDTTESASPSEQSQEPAQAAEQAKEPETEPAAEPSTQATETPAGGESAPPEISVSPPDTQEAGDSPPEETLQAEQQQSESNEGGGEQAEVDDIIAKAKQRVDKAEERAAKREARKSSPQRKHVSIDESLDEEPPVSVYYHRNAAGKVIGDYQGRDYLPNDDDQPTFDPDDYKVEPRKDMQEFLHYKTAPARSLVKQQEELLQRLRSLRANLEQSETISDGAKAESSALGSRLSWRQEEIGDLDRHREYYGDEPRYTRRGVSYLSRYRQRKAASVVPDMDDDDNDIYYRRDDYRPTYSRFISDEQPSRFYRAAPDDYMYSSYTPEYTRSYREYKPDYEYRPRDIEYKTSYDSDYKTRDFDVDYKPGSYKERFTRLLDEISAPATSAVRETTVRSNGDAYDRYWQRYGADDTPYAALSSQGLLAPDDLANGRSPSPLLDDMQEIEAC